MKLQLFRVYPSKSIYQPHCWWSNQGINWIYYFLLSFHRIYERVRSHHNFFQFYQISSYARYAIGSPGHHDHHHFTQNRRFNQIYPSLPKARSYSIHSNRLVNLVSFERSFNVQFDSDHFRNVNEHSCFDTYDVWSLTDIYLSLLMMKTSLSLLATNANGCSGEFDVVFGVNHMGIRSFEPQVKGIYLIIIFIREFIP